MQIAHRHLSLACSKTSFPQFWRWFLIAALLALVSACASLPANTNRTASKAFDAPATTPLGQLANARRGEAKARSDSAFKLIDKVELAYTARYALIQAAERSLDLQYYAIHADASTETILQALRAAARRGVKVRILLDDFNTVGEDAQVLRLAFEPNVEMRLFNPVPGSRSSLVGRIIGSLHDIERLQKRMHNKLLIADNAWGVTGGRNLGDQYFGTDDKQNFVDLDVLAVGRVVRDMSSSFDRFWNDELAYPVQTLLDPEDLQKLRELAKDKGSRDVADPHVAGPTSAPLAAPPSAPPGGSTVLPTVTQAEADAAKRPGVDLRSIPLVWAPATFLVDKPGKIGPGDDEVDAGDTVIDGLLKVMESAQRDVLIVSPYFVPGQRMMDVYGQLRERNVRIRVLTNSLASNDAVAAHAGYARYRKALLDMGVELYEMRSDPANAPELAGSAGGSHGRGFGLGSGAGGSKSATSRASLHSKAVIIDGRLSVIGSMNLDLRSQLKNSEVALVIRSPALAAEATRQLEETFAVGAYRVERDGAGLLWRAPRGASFADSRSEPDASTKQKLLVNLVGPFAPDEML